jgi:dihydroxyacid dehydratase/phosphogluconate dehydratase
MSPKSCWTRRGCALRPGGRPIARLRDRDIITINGVTGELSVALSEAELEAFRAA